MKNKKKIKRVIYALSMSPELYELVAQVCDNTRPRASRASVMREALLLGLNQMKLQQEVSHVSV